MKKKFALYYEAEGGAHAILSSEETYLRDVYVLSCAHAESITKVSIAMLLSMINDHVEEDALAFTFPFDEEREFQEEYMWQYHSIEAYNRSLMNKKDCTEVYDMKPMFSDYEEECFLEFCAKQKAMEILALMPKGEEDRIIKALKELIW